VIEISLPARDLSDGQKFFLTFSRLDVPYISRGLWPGFLGSFNGLKFFLTFS
jgi:hypothetical protein